ncbi:MAG TPA: hypothetical protein VKQ52_02910, partial [Puia sp.]|nr:hypothetical protein [Puia sp.]
MFRPFALMSKTNILILIAAQVLFVLIVWQLSPGGLIPGPLRVLEALGQLLTTRLLFDNLFSSLLLTLRALVYSVVLTLLFSYLSVLPFFRPVAQFMVKCRYLTLTGLIFIFTLLTRDGGALKLSLLVFGIVPFFMTSFLSVILRTPAQE